MHNYHYLYLLCLFWIFQIRALTYRLNLISDKNDFKGLAKLLFTEGGVTLQTRHLGQLNKSPSLPPHPHCNQKIRKKLLSVLHRLGRSRNARRSRRDFQ